MVTFSGTEMRHLSLTGSISSRPRILAIEDSALNRMVLEALLAPLDVVLIFAEDGATGVELANGCNPDLILMDLLMPRMDGIETLQAIRAAEREYGRKKSPAILLTAAHRFLNDALKAECLFDDFVRKPIDGDLLCAAVQKLLHPVGPGSLVIDMPQIVSSQIPGNGR